MSAGWAVGQNIYTPTDITAERPDPSDRPYGGWLYYGLMFQRASACGRALHSYEADVGLTGPPARRHVAFA